MAITQSSGREFTFGSAPKGVNYNAYNLGSPIKYTSLYLSLIHI